MNAKEFDRILRRVGSAKENVDEEQEQLVIYDTKSGEITFEEEVADVMFRFFGMNSKEYYIANFSNFIHVDDCMCEFTNADAKLHVKLNIGFKLRCKKGKVHKALRFIKKPGNLFDALALAITNWVEDFRKENSLLLRQFTTFDTELRKYIATAAETKGFAIDVIKIDPIFTNIHNQTVHAHITLVHTTRCETANSQIEINNKIVLNLVDERALSWNNITNPEAWIKNKVDEVIQNKLLTKKYKNVISEFDNDLGPRIKDELERIVQQIGYSIQHILAVPSEELRVFLEGFSFRTDVDDLGNRMFSDTFITKQSGVSVKLSVTVEARGTSVKNLNELYIKPGFSIVGEVKKQIIEELNREIQTIQPEEIYAGDIGLLEERLSGAISNRLQREFGAVLIRINLRALDNPITERLKMLFGHNGTFGITSYDAKLNYNITYKVKGISNWSSFSSNQVSFGAGNQAAAVAEYTQISKLLKSNIELTWKAVAPVNFRQSNLMLLDDEVRRLFTESQDIITREFGVVLGEPQLERTESHVHAASVEAITRGALLRMREEVEKRLIEAMVGRDSPEIIKEYQDELIDITDKINNLDNSLNKKFLLDNKDNSKEDSGRGQ